ncbi:hypothetical protein NHX12_015259 [Muraenolepis orangiensis]|uniref:Dipeptidylpeptidase IV N-terminal domain-containing protein n=1 Tax=Muraenolepis orangiensis TaxID=630683 RepID=A0A9Q0D9I7_9TELE|nr:hypothetical protein NHX12_015259 [Muraenolepis orangiensis]
MTASSEPTKKKKPKEQDEDFVDVSPTQRNWKGIAISLLVIVGVCALISGSVILLTPADVRGVRKSKASSSAYTSLRPPGPVADFKAVQYSLSPDLKFALLSYDVTRVYRYSSTASYLVYNLHTSCTSLRTTSTTSLACGAALSGSPQEILKSNLAYWWSPDGERLAFLTINDTLVPNMALPQFTGSMYPRGLHYPYPTVCVCVCVYSNASARHHGKCGS